MKNNHRVYGLRHGRKKVVIKKRKKEDDHRRGIIDDSEFSNSGKLTFNKNVFCSSESSDNGSPFENLVPNRNRISSRRISIQNNFIRGSLTDSERSTEKSDGSFGLFKSPKCIPSPRKKSVKKRAVKRTEVIQKRNITISKKDKSKKNCYRLDDDSWESSIPGAELMLKDSEKQHRGATVPENYMNFDEFDEYSLCVENMADENKFGASDASAVGSTSKRANESRVDYVSDFDKSVTNKSNITSVASFSTPKIDSRGNDVSAKCVSSLAIPNVSRLKTNEFSNPIKASTPHLLNRASKVGLNQPVRNFGTPALSPVHKDSLYSVSDFMNSFARTRQSSRNHASFAKNLTSSRRTFDGNTDKLQNAVRSVINSSRKNILSDHNLSANVAADTSKLDLKPAVVMEHLSESMISSLQSKSMYVNERKSRRHFFRPVKKSCMFTSFICPELAPDYLLRSFNESMSCCIAKSLDSARDIVFKQCRQQNPLQFVSYIDSRKAENSPLVKVGEGTYGEVYTMETIQGPSIVTKIVPIQGNQVINESVQKTFQEILSEIVVSVELSSLREAGFNSTSNFVLVHRVACVQGCYPQELLQAWDSFDKLKGSENERPDIFGDDQLYISFEFGYAGICLEDFTLTNSQQGIGVFMQVACALAVAERMYKFEHRDLHWGNILVTHTDDPLVVYSMQGLEFEVESHGILITIIDFTLSRLDKDGCTVYCDLATDENDGLFTGEDDYQFEVYRLMKQHTNDDWSGFHPYTNVLWLNYLLDKLLNGVKYKNKRSKVHREAIKSMKAWQKSILNYQSAYKFALKEKLLTSE